MANFNNSSCFFILGALINIPFIREVKRPNIESVKTGIRPNESIYSDVSAVGISSLILGTMFVFIGIWISSIANMGAPLIARFFSKKPMNEIISKDAVVHSFVLVVIVTLVLLGLFEIQKEFYPVAHKLSRPAKPFYALVALSAGITEEIIFRLGVMSLILTGILLIKKAKKPSKKNGLVKYNNFSFIFWAYPSSVVKEFCSADSLYRRCNNDW